NGGIHANEVLGAQQLIENIHQLVSRTDSETMRFLNDVIILNCLVNPDGMELVSDWYMHEREPTRRSTGASRVCITNMPDMMIIVIFTCRHFRKPRPSTRS